jgi:hypothetical protein
MLSSQIMSFSSSYPDHTAEVLSSSFFVSSSSNRYTALANAAMMPYWEQQASSPSSPAREETTNSSTAAERSEPEMLPASFLPHEHSVVCGRGNKCINAPGSQRLKIIASKFLQKYAHTKCKKSKAVIVADIIDLVRSECPNGGQGAFVRFHQNHWWEVDELGARQKVTTVMRDGLHTMYKSSSKSKVAKRRTRKVLEHRRQESVPSTSTSASASSILEPVTLNSAITKNYQKTQDMFQRTFVPKIFCDQKDLEEEEEGILRGESSPLEPIALHHVLPSRTYFRQHEHQEKFSTSFMHKASNSSSRLLLQNTAMQRRRKVLGHLEQAERTLEMFEPLEPTPTMHVSSTSISAFNNSPSFNNHYESKKQQDCISVVTPPTFRRNMFVFCRRENHAGEGDASSSCSSSLTGDHNNGVGTPAPFRTPFPNNDVGTPAPFRPPFPVDASFDIDNIFD